MPRRGGLEQSDLGLSDLCLRRGGAAYGDGELQPRGQREWRSRYGAALGRDDEFLLRFCEAIYPPAEPSNLQSHRARSILTPEELDVFHRARVGVADYFHQCGSRRARSAKFARFLE